MSQRPPPSPAILYQRGLSRRAALILAGVGAAAAGVGWRLSRPGTNALASGPAAVPTPDSITARTTSTTAGSAPAGADTLPADFWQQSFDRPDGGQIALASLRGKPLLINFWATWCPPCVKELPELDRFHQAYAPKGWTVLGLAIDSPTPVKAFLAKVRVGFPLGLAGLNGTELSQSMGNEAGGLPFTVMVDAQGHIVHRKMGGTHFDELATWARALTP